MLTELQEIVKDIEFGNPENVGDKLKPLLKNKNIFGIDLYQVGLGEKIENMVRIELVGIRAVRTKHYKNI